MGHLAPFTWIYQMAEVFPNLVKTIEFRRISPNGLIRAMSSQEVTLSLPCYHSVKVQSQLKHGAPFKVVRDFSALPKSTLFWIFEISFINNLPWDLGEWHWQATAALRDLPFFGYSAKWGYMNLRRPFEVFVIHSFI